MRPSLAIATFFAIVQLWSLSARAGCVSAGVNLDEHLLVDPPRDEDYAGGLSIYAATRDGRCGPRWSTHGLKWLDEHLWRTVRPDHDGPSSNAIGGGLLVMTPGHLRARQAVLGDRPYSSLLYLSATRESVFDDENSAIDSTITFGIMGLGLAQGVQHVLHDATGSAQARGWSHQISSGGEPTARVEISRQSLWSSSKREGSLQADLKGAWTVNVGTLTDVGLAFNARAGRIASPWWSVAPEQNTYADGFGSVASLPTLNRPELFVMAGGRVRLRAYDAFLQGQFRHSDLRYSPTDRQPILMDAWLGVQWMPRNGLVIRYVARFQTPELRYGNGSRNLLWGSIEFAFLPGA